MRQRILANVAARYLASEQFNGEPGDSLIEGFPEDEVANELQTLITEGLVSLNFGDRHPNRHIKALPALLADEQIRKMRESGIRAACVYPEEPLLREVVDRDQYAGKPYTLTLALGGAQLEHRGFDLSVLERYRNDPRFLYRNDDISGTFSIHDEFFGPDGPPEQDQVSMQTFGFCFDQDQNCYVAAFLRYLADLSPSHQQYWAGLEVAVRTRLHPDYFRPSFLGEFPERMSIYTAILAEIRTNNDRALAIRGMPLFRRDFRNEEKPPRFGRLVRPTAHEYGQFLLTLDQLLSDNLSIHWFPADLPRHREIERPDGRIEVRQLGSIQLFSEWLQRDVTLESEESRNNVEEMLGTFREVRRLRMRPAHALDDNGFQQELTREQRELLKSVYRALKTLRLVLSLHPAAGGIQVPAQIADGRIWSI
jgi:hypothetical protein